MAGFIERKVDGIITDFPDVLKELMIEIFEDEINGADRKSVV